MKYFQEELAKICKDHPFEDKFLIAPSFNKGEALLKNMGKKGHPLFNIRVTTPIEMAKNITAKDLQKENLNLLGRSEAKQIVFNVMEGLIDKDKLTYFNHLKPSGGIISSILSAINEVKMADIVLDEELEESDVKFVTQDKQSDLIAIFCQYQKYLQESSSLDEADVLRRAKQKSLGNTHTSSKYIIPVDYYNDLKQMEKHLIDNLLKEFLYIIDTNNIKDDKKTKENIQLFSAYGESTEVKNVLSKIREEELPFDKTTVLYSTSSPYVELICHLCENYEIPVTFGEGVMIHNTRPGKLFFMLLDWINDDYKVTELNKILAENLIELKDEMLSSFKIRKMLRQAYIGWSRDRYFEVLEKTIADFESKAPKNSEKDDWLDKKLSDYKSLYKLVDELFTCLPSFEKDDEQNIHVGLAHLAAGLSNLIDKFAKTSSQLDQEAKKNICEELKIISNISNSTLDIRDSTTRLKESIEKLSVGQDLPKPGHIHVDHYQNGNWVMEDNVFLVGFDADRFPGNRREDPMLLDQEREKLSSHLPLRKDRPKENYKEIISLLDGVTDRVIISYSSFDTAEHKEKFPSSFILTVFRQLTGNLNADYSKLQDFLKPPKRIIPTKKQEIFDRIDEWLYLFNILGEEIELSHIVEHYPHFTRGIAVLNNRMSSEFTLYDGNVSVTSQLIDPRKAEKAMSPTRLEFLAKCPFGYFLSYVLGVNPPEDMEYDPSKWLDALSRGSLLHSIYENFYNKLKETNEGPKETKHHQYLTEMADELIEKQKEELPPPSDFIYQYEREEILSSLKVFLRREEEHTKYSYPLYTELSFGPSSNIIQLKLPSGDFLNLAGKIDRVDQDGEGNCFAYDYKTGSTYNYSERKYYQGGRQLQHALYALALEKILNEKYPDKNIKVKGAGYIFPTIKGQGARYKRDYQEVDKENFLQLLEDLLDLLSSGNFVMTDDEGDCTFCDYKVVCERNMLVESFKEMFETSKELELFRKVRSHD